MNRIQIILKQRGLDQAFIAKELGVTTAMFSRWSNNVSQPPWEYLVKLGEQLSIDINKLTYQNPISIAFKNNTVLKLNNMGVTDVFLSAIDVKHYLKSYLKITIWVETKYRDGSSFKYPIPFPQKLILKNQTIQFNTIIDQADYSTIWIEGLENKEVNLLFLRPIAMSEKQICSYCDGFGSTSEGNGFFQVNETPPTSTTCPSCGGKGYYEIEFPLMNETIFAMKGLHNYHIAFRTIGNDQLFSGVVLDNLNHDEKSIPTEYSFIPTKNLVKYKELDRKKGFKQLKNLTEIIDISTISWARKII